MAKATPAHIIYETANGEEQVINFHAVVTEDHGASSQITKYPVQTGKHISNHAIRNNRTISLSGAYSNYVFTSSDRFAGEATSSNPSKETQGSDTNKVMFEVLESLVQSGQVCKVVTNLDIYETVVFNRFTTKQAAGSVDTLNFTISGEEIVVVSEKNDNAPIPLAFSVLSGAKREAVVYELESLGINTTASDEISKVDWNIGDDFSINDVDEVGNPVKTTYIFKGRDPATSLPNYEIHFSESAVEVDGLGEEVASGSCCSTLSDAEKLKKKIKTSIGNVSDCFTDTITDELLSATEDSYNTAIGKLTRSAYGYLYDITSGDGVGAALIKAGISCVVQTATASDETDPVNAVRNSLPTVEDMFEGAQQGLGFGDVKKEKATLIQVKSGCGGC